MGFTREWRLVLVALGACGSAMTSPTRPRIVAHRGASEAHPENTLAAFRAAWARGVEAVELDVHVTQDGEVVVIHDDNTKRTGGVDRRVAEQTLVELKQLDVGNGERIPTLAEALATIPRRHTLFVEIKTDVATVPAIAHVIGRRKDVALQGFDPDALAALQAATGAPAYWTVGPPRDGDRRLPYPLVLVDDAKARGFTGLALFYGAVTPELVAHARAFGVLLDVWTVNDATLVERWLAQGVRWVETDRP
jgi:glycerophosphoryl diester phosphodiesterase